MRNIQPRDVLNVKTADPPCNSFAPDRDGLVGHDLRPHSQAVFRRRIDRHAKIRCVVALRGHLANHDRCMTLAGALGLPTTRQAKPNSPSRYRQQQTFGFRAHDGSRGSTVGTRRVRPVHMLHQCAMCTMMPHAHSGTVQSLSHRDVLQRPRTSALSHRHDK
jgi:hypothetical protein